MLLVLSHHTCPLLNLILVWRIGKMPASYLDRDWQTVEGADRLSRPFIMGIQLCRSLQRIFIEVRCKAICLTHRLSPDLRMSPPAKLTSWWTKAALAQKALVTLRLFRRPVDSCSISSDAVCSVISVLFGFKTPQVLGTSETLAPLLFDMDSRESLHSLGMDSRTLVGLLLLFHASIRPSRRSLG